MDLLRWDEIEQSGPDEFHAVTTLTVRELLSLDVPLFDEMWDVDDIDWYSAEVKERVWRKFVRHFGYREIGILPPGRWMDRVTSTLVMVMPKYNALYDQLDKGMTYMQDGDEWHKGRDVRSEFPQQRLWGNNVDYASGGMDTEHETIRYKDPQQYLETVASYNDVDRALLEELELLFMQLVTLNVNM